uniref:Uncharacterized protein n=1 Tax=Anopheles dirus TaxID=7168 RepID=A0A182NH43_9DIPT
MTRPYCLLAVASGCLLLLLPPTLGDRQRGFPTGKARGAAAEESGPPGRIIRTQLAGGFIDDDDANGARNSGTAQRAPPLRKAPVHGTSGPVHTYIKTDKNANFKWGVRHFVGKKYARR